MIRQLNGAAGLLVAGRRARDGPARAHIGSSGRSQPPAARRLCRPARLTFHRRAPPPPHCLPAGPTRSGSGRTAPRRRLRPRSPSPPPWCSRCSSSPWWCVGWGGVGAGVGSGGVGWGWGWVVGRRPRGARRARTAWHGGSASLAPPCLFTDGACDAAHPHPLPPRRCPCCSTLATLTRTEAAGWARRSGTTLRARACAHWSCAFDRAREEKWRAAPRPACS